MTLRFQLFKHKAGIKVAQSWGSIIHAGHLYNAVQQNGLLEEKFDSWKDMELVIKYHGNSGLFYGARPDCIKDQYTQNCLLIGHVASNLAKNRRNVPFKFVSRSHKKVLETLAPVTSKFADMVFGFEPRQPFTFADVENILDKARAMKPNDKTVQNSSETSENSLLDDNLSKKWKKHHRCTPVELLSTLQTVLQGEISELFLDYLRFHRTCLLILPVIREAVEEELSGMFGSDIIAKESEISFVVCLILMAAVEPQQARVVFKHRIHHEASFEMLEKAGVVLTSAIKTIGDHHTLELAEVMNPTRECECEHCLKAQELLEEESKQRANGSDDHESLALLETLVASLKNLGSLGEIQEQMVGGCYDQESGTFLKTEAAWFEEAQMVRLSDYVAGGGLDQETNKSS